MENNTYSSLNLFYWKLDFWFLFGVSCNAGICLVGRGGGGLGGEEGRGSNVEH